MNVHFTYKLDKSPSVEQYLQSQIEKLGPRLQVFNPDMVSLRGLFELAPKSGFQVSLNLRLPAGQMAVHAAADTLQGAIRNAFDDLTEQLRKHKDHLRSEYRFARVRTERKRIDAEGAFANTVAVVKPEKISTVDVNGFVNANLERLRLYVERELRFRRDSGQRRLEAVSVEEVIDEAIANALDERNPRPEKIALEPWLYRLSRSAMDRLGNQLNSGAHSVRLEEADDTHPATEVDGEEMMQFFHPDESPTNESLIADRRGSTPEDEASRQELMTMVERSLRGATPQQRESFLLFTLEGFRLAEIAAITDRTQAEVQADVTAARERLRHALATSERGKKKTAARQPRSA